MSSATGSTGFASISHVNRERDTGLWRLDRIEHRKQPCEEINIRAVRIFPGSNQSGDDYAPACLFDYSPHLLQAS
jgi:hypothetical protein